MAESFLSSVPIAAPETMPWNWNPAATFVAAFNTQRLTERKMQEMQMNNQLERILFPYKESAAQLELQKLMQEVERGTLVNKKLMEANAKAHVNVVAGINSAGSNVAGNGGSSNQQQSNTIDWNAYGKTNQSDDSVLLE